jgi:RNA polymerase sigma-70 factor (ECF subfamily)
MSQAEGAVTPDDGDLVRWMAAVAEHRDRDAFEQLFRYYAPRLQRYMLKAGMGPEAAEDMVQETMVEVWRKARLYRAEIGRVSTWIFTIARNLRIDRLRAHRHVEVPLEPEVHAATSEDLDHGLRVDAQRLVEQLRSLPSEQRHVMQLSYLEGLSHSEIGRRLGLPLGTVKSRLRLAFARTRERMAAD